MPNNTIQILKDLISIESDNDDKIKNIADYVCAILDKNNIIYKRIKHTENHAESIIAAINANDLRNINSGLLLSGHIDTVPGKSTQFLPVYKDGKIYGRGAVDMKYFIAILLATIPEMKKQKYPIILALTGDEETDVTGIRHISDFMRTNNIHPHTAIVGEPTNMNTIVAHNGYCGYTTTVRGISAHGSQVNSGINSVYIAADIILFIKNLAEQYANNGTTINIGRIYGGTQRNTVAEQTVFDWEIRYKSNTDQKRIMESVMDFQNKLTQTNPGLKIENKIAEEICALRPPQNSKIAETIASVQETQTQTSAIATEAGFLQAFGIDTVVFGAGDIKCAHTDNEYISETDIYKYTETLIKIINSFSQTTIQE